MLIHQKSTDLPFSSPVRRYIELPSELPSSQRLAQFFQNFPSSTGCDRRRFDAARMSMPAGEGRTGLWRVESGEFTTDAAQTDEDKDSLFIRE